MSKIILRVAIAIGAAAFIYFVLVLLTPTFGNVVGYANSQPELRVERMPGATSETALRYIYEQSTAQFKKIPDADEHYWPIPARIVERQDCWLVEFVSRDLVYEFLGIRHVYRPSDKVMHMSITKSDLVLRYGKWCDPAAKP